MIAIFAKQNMLRGFNLLPKHEFVIVKLKEDILGRTFTGVILRYDIWSNREQSQAYVELKRRQPELFK